MTGYTVNTGSNEKFREGWDQIFKPKKSASTPARKSKQAKAGKDVGSKGPSQQR